MLTSEDRDVAVKKEEFVRKAYHFRKLVGKHEKEKTLNKTNCTRECCSVLEEFDNKLLTDLTTERNGLQQQLQKIRNGVYRFQGQLIDVKPSPDLIDKLKDTMTEVELSINNFKEDQHQSFEELLKEEGACWLEICAFEKKIDTWSLSAQPGPKLPSVPAAKIRRDQTGQEEPLPEVTAVEAFLQQTGGRHGGWDQYDHQSFLKVWTKHSGRPSYRKEAKLYLPSKTEEDIKQHEDWYLRLCYLLERKKEGIRRWREERLRGRSRWLEQRNEEEVSKRRELAELAEAKRHQLERQRKEAEERLQAWKSQRQLRQEQEEERKLREEVLQLKRTKEEQRRQLEVKLALEVHIRERKEQEEHLLLERERHEQAEMEERRKVAAVQIKRFQRRDMHKLETKLQEKLMKEEEELEQQNKLAKLKEKVEVHITRDPSRLCRPTKGWEERTKEIGPTGGGPVNQMFHRAVPTWRQGL